MDYREWRRDLQEWRSPEKLRDELTSARPEHGSNLLTAGGTEFFREACSACQFALLREATRVRLVAGPRPDFEMDVTEGARKFEVTEANTPGRSKQQCECSRQRTSDEISLVMFPGLRRSPFCAGGPYRDLSSHH